MGLFGGLLSLAAPLIGDLFGASSSSKAIKNATAAQTAASQAAIGEQQREYDTTRSDFAPYMGFGKSALGPLGDLLGLNGNDASAAAIAKLKDSPLYQSLFSTGEESVLQNASATGGVRGGNTQGALYELGSNTLSQVIQNQIQNLFGASGVGTGATNSVMGAGTNAANNISGLRTQIGSQQAGGILGQASVGNNLINQISALFSPANMQSLGIKI